jgi:hypothetical protein
VTIEEQGALPQAVMSGLDVSPGHSTSFAVTAQYLERLHKPYGECSDNATLYDMNEYTYTSFGCLSLCTQHYIWDNCGCVSYSLPVPDFLLAESFCGKYNETSPAEYFEKTTCEQLKWQEFDASGALRVGCKCYEPCEQYTYDVGMSESAWPGDEYVEDFYKDMVDSQGTKASEQLGGISPTNTTSFANLIRANFARINVYFKGLDTKVRVQEASFVMSSLWSAIGGTIGLWAGISVITLVDITTFLVKLMVPVCRQKVNTTDDAKAPVSLVLVK